MSWPVLKPKNHVAMSKGVCWQNITGMWTPIPSHLNTKIHLHSNCVSAFKGVVDSIPSALVLYAIAQKWSRRQRVWERKSKTKKGKRPMLCTWAWTIVAFLTAQLPDLVLFNFGTPRFQSWEHQKKWNWRIVNWVPKQNFSPWQPSMHLQLLGRRAKKVWSQLWRCTPKKWQQLKWLILQHPLRPLG